MSVYVFQTSDSLHVTNGNNNLFEAKYILYVLKTS